jgi:hypothetical protein
LCDNTTRACEAIFVEISYPITTYKSSSAIRVGSRWRNELCVMDSICPPMTPDPRETPR